MRASGMLIAMLCSLAGCGSGPLDAVALDLVAHWTFDEGMGGKVRDSSPNQRDGIINGGTWSWVPQGRFGAGLHLEQGDYVSVDNFPDATRGWTVSVWVQVASQNVGTIGEVTVISTEDVFKGGWEMNLTSSSDTEQYHFGFWAGPGPADYAHCECANCIQPDKWQHVVAVVDGASKTVAIYLDGVWQAQASVRQPIAAGVPTLYMGRWATTDPARLFAGSLDDISIWNRPLRPDEIASLTRAPAP
jgi:hypothetical protein